MNSELKFKSHQWNKENRIGELNNFFNINRKKHPFYFLYHDEKSKMLESIYSFIHSIVLCAQNSKEDTNFWKKAIKSVEFFKIDKIGSAFQIENGFFEFFIQFFLSFPISDVNSEDCLKFILKTSPVLNCTISAFYFEAFLDKVFQKFIYLETFSNNLKLLNSIIDVSNKDLLLKMKHDHIEFIVKCLQKNVEKGNIYHLETSIIHIHNLIKKITSHIQFDIQQLKPIFNKLANILCDIIKQDLEIYHTFNLLSFLLNAQIIFHDSDLFHKDFVKKSIFRYFLNPISDDFAIIGIQFCKGLILNSYEDFQYLVCNFFPDFFQKLTNLSENNNRILKQEVILFAIELLFLESEKINQLFEKCEFPNEVLMILCHSKCNELTKLCLQFFKIYADFGNISCSCLMKSPNIIYDVFLKKINVDLVSNQDIYLLIFDTIEEFFKRGQIEAIKNGSNKNYFTEEFIENGFFEIFEKMKESENGKISAKIEVFVEKYFEPCLEN